MLGALLHQEVLFPMLLNKPFKGEVALALPHLCVDKVVFLLEFLIPLVLSYILAFERHPSGSSILPSLERFGGC